MKFSLVMATYGRVDEIKRFLGTLDQQTFRNWELIVVDQNPDDRVAKILPSDDERIRRITSPVGVSKARSAGIAESSGDVVGFPDDDCWFSAPTFLENVAKHFLQDPSLDILSGRSADFDGSAGHVWPLKAQQLTERSVWFCATAYTLYFRKRVINSVNTFDHRLGPGANTAWGAGEEIDFLLRALRHSTKAQYEPSLLTYHPAKKDLDANVLKARAASYAMGAGAVMRNNDVSPAVLLYFSARSLFGFIRSLALFDAEDAERYAAVLLGRLLGWVTWSK